MLGAPFKGREGDDHLLPPAKVVGERRLKPLGRIGTLVDADIVHVQGLRKDGRLVRVARPVAAHRHVQDDEEGVVKDPLAGDIIGRRRKELYAVHVPADLVWLPLDGIHVKVIRERFAIRIFVPGANPSSARVARAVDGAVHRGGLAPDVLHDVQLAGLRPADLADVRAQGPEGRPQSLAKRDLETGFNPPVGKLGLVPRDESRRGILARPIVADERTIGFLGRDHQVALAIGGRVLGAAGIVLQLGVAPAGVGIDRAVADLVRPVGRVGGGARRIIELVAPHQAPAATSGLAVVLELHRDRIAAVRAVEPEAQRLATRPVLAEGKVAGESTFAAGDDGLAVKGFAGQRELRRITVIAGFLETEVEDQVDVPITVKVCLVTLGLTGLFVAVGFGGIAKEDRVVIDGQRIEAIGRQNRDRHDAVALIAEAAVHHHIHQDGRGGLQDPLVRPLSGQRQRIARRDLWIGEQDLVR